jgi:hypothetical protein
VVGGCPIEAANMVRAMLGGTRRCVCKVVRYVFISNYVSAFAVTLAVQLQACGLLLLHAHTHTHTNTSTSTNTAIDGHPSRPMTARCGACLPMLIISLVDTAPGKC